MNVPRTACGDPRAPRPGRAREASRRARCSSRRTATRPARPRRSTTDSAGISVCSVQPARRAAAAGIDRDDDPVAVRRRAPRRGSRRRAGRGAEHHARGARPRAPRRPRSALRSPPPTCTGTSTPAAIRRTCSRLRARRCAPRRDRRRAARGRRPAPSAGRRRAGRRRRPSAGRSPRGPAAPPCRRGCRSPAAGSCARGDAGPPTRAARVASSQRRRSARASAARAAEDFSGWNWTPNTLLAGDDRGEPLAVLGACRRRPRRRAGRAASECTW